jgi:DNA mismatch endonuclease (patch repair protein)
MRGNRSKDTKPEIALRKALWAKGVRGYRKNVAGLPGKPDLVFARLKLCVFVHGCFWHVCPKCDEQRNLRPAKNFSYWEEKREQTRARDALQIEELTTAGWRVIVVWECELKPKQIADAVDRVRQELEPRSS